MEKTIKIIKDARRIVPIPSAQLIQIKGGGTIKKKEPKAT